MNDKHKSAKKAALEKLMEVMDAHSAGDLKGIKGKPVAEMSVTKISPMDKEDGEDDKPFEFGKSWDEGSPEEEASESPDEEKMEDEPSESDKAKIADLYHRYCK